MAGRSGIEYHYRFWTHGDVFLTPHDHCTLFAGTKNPLFDIRTDFVLKSTDGEEILDSERLSWCSTAEDGDRGFDLISLHALQASRILDD